MNNAAREAIYRAQDAIEQALWALSQENHELQEDLEHTKKLLKDAEGKLAAAEKNQKTVSQAKIDATSEILEMFVNNRAAFDEAVRIYEFAQKVKEEARKKKEEERRKQEEAEQRRQEEAEKRRKYSRNSYRNNWYYYNFSNDPDEEDFDEFYERFHEDFFGQKRKPGEGPFGSRQGQRSSPGSAESWWIILEVERTACESVIKKSYRSLAMKYHPDNRDTGDETKMKSVNRAMEQARAEKGFK